MCGDGAGPMGSLRFSAWHSFQVFFTVDTPLTAKSQLSLSPESSLLSEQPCFPGLPFSIQQYPDALPTSLLEQALLLPEDGSLGQ